MQASCRILLPNDWERENTYLKHLEKLQRVYTLPSQVKQTQLQFKSQKVSSEKSRLEHARFKTAQRKSIQLLENKKMLNAMLRISTRENQTLFRITNQGKIHNQKDQSFQIKNARSTIRDQDETKQQYNSSDEKDQSLSKQDSLERETYPRKNQEKEQVEEEQENIFPCQDINNYSNRQSQTYQGLPTHQQDFEQFSHKINHTTSNNNRSFNSNQSKNIITPQISHNYITQQSTISRTKTDNNHTQPSVIEKENYHLALRMIHTGSTYSKVSQDEDYRIHQDRMNRLRKFKKSQQFNIPIFRNISPQSYSNCMKNCDELKQPSRSHSETTEGGGIKRNHGLGFKESSSNYANNLLKQSQNIDRKLKITTDGTQKKNSQGYHSAARSNCSNKGAVDSMIVSLQFASLDILDGVSGQCSLIIGAAGDNQDQQEHTYSDQSSNNQHVRLNSSQNYHKTSNVNSNLDNPNQQNYLFQAESNIFDFSNISVLAFSFPLPRFLLHKDLTCRLVSHSELRRQVIGGFQIPPISLSQDEQLQSASVVSEETDIGTAVFSIKQEEVSDKMQNDRKVPQNENKHSRNQQQQYLPRLPKYSKSRSFTLGNSITSNNATYSNQTSQLDNVTSSLTSPLNNIVSPQFSQQSSRSIQYQKRQLFSSLARQTSFGQ